MAKPLAVQLYSLRQYSEKDFLAVIERVAKIGYAAVEPAGFFTIRPSLFRKVLEDNGLKMISSHTPWANANNLGEAMDLADTIGLKRIVCGYNPEDFKDLDAIKRTAEKTNRMQEILASNGFELFQHNHYWEFYRTNGRFNYEIYAELCPKVKFELDCFWTTNYGKEDPVAILKQFGDRTILLHMKDGVCTQEQKNTGDIAVKDGFIEPKAEMMALGTGTLPIPQLIAAMPEHVEAIVVELDFCNTDMWEAIEKSYTYMISNGLAAGNK